MVKIVWKVTEMLQKAEFPTCAFYVITLKVQRKLQKAPHINTRA